MTSDNESARRERKTPSTLRLAPDQLAALDQVAAATRLTRSALMSLGVDALIDHFKRTGKLFVCSRPTGAPKKSRHGHRG